MPKKIIHIVGGGPAGMMAAEMLSRRHEVHLYEQGKRLGRKFLVAGKGGFNLTNVAQGDILYKHYLPPEVLRPALSAFDSVAVRNWLADLQIPTFVGTSGRIFPEKDIKPVTVLQNWTDRLIEQGVHFHYHHQFVGFNDQQLPVIQHQDQRFSPPGDQYVFALGGASWPKTGSTGDWLAHFKALGVATVPFAPSNCGVHIAWPTSVLQHHSGKPLKNISLSVGSRRQKGEVNITDYGLEGNAVYPLIPWLRTALYEHKAAILSIDFKPNNSEAQLLAKLAHPQTRSPNYQRLLNLDRTQMTLLKAYTSKQEYLEPATFVKTIKHLPLQVQALRPLEEAISTVGGIALSEINANFALQKYPHLTVIGEMLDWDAPTGGFLLQACFSMGAYLQRD